MPAIGRARRHVPPRTFALAGRNLRRGSGSSIPAGPIASAAELARVPGAPTADTHHTVHDEVLSGEDAPSSICPTRQAWRGAPQPGGPPCPRPNRTTLPKAATPELTPAHGCACTDRRPDCGDVPARSVGQIAGAPAPPAGVSPVLDLWRQSGHASLDQHASRRRRPGRKSGHGSRGRVDGQLVDVVPVWLTTSRAAAHTWSPTRARAGERDPHKR